MKKYIWLIVGLAVIAVLVIYLQAKPVSEGTPPSSTSTNPTATTTPVVSNTLPYGEVTLSLNESAHFADITLTPTSVVEDSRCPMGVYCIQAGTVRVQVKIHSTSGTTTSTIGLDKSSVISGTSITLSKVAPPKAQQKPIKDSDYQFTFDVKKATTASPAPASGCYVGGCSGEICSSDPNTVSACLYQESYACYKTAICEKQTSGQCGWTQTASLKMCLANANSGSPAVQ
jgi:hypothetical protein